MKVFNKATEAALRFDITSCPDIVLECPIDGIETDFKAYFKHLRNLSTRSFGTSESQVGILNRHDLFQEVCYQFIKAWNNIDWEKIDMIEPPEEKRRRLWTYIEQSIHMGLLREVRKVADGMPVSEYMHNKHGNDKDHVKFNQFTALNDIAVNQVSTDATSLKLKYFLEELFDKYLDRTKTGKRRADGLQRAVMERSFGLGLHGGKMTYKEIADDLGIKDHRVRDIKTDCMEILKMEEPKAWMDESPKDALARFVYENDINTSSGLLTYVDDRFEYGIKDGRKKSTK